MRTRRHQRGSSVLIGSFLGSILFNILFALPLFAVLGTYLTHSGRDAPVKVVRLSAAQWSKNMRTASNASKLPPHLQPTSRDTAPVPDLSKKDDAKQAPVEEKKPPVEEKMSGQIVEVPPTADDRPNPEAKYLSKYNSHVEKEMVARPEDRDPKLKRLTNKLQTTESPGPTEKFIPTTNLSLKGDGMDEDIEGTKGDKNDVEKKQKFVLELPDIARRDQVNLQLGEGPGLGNSVANRTGSDAVKGNSDHLDVQLGSGTEEQGGEAGGGKKGAADGSDDKKPLPTLAALMPALGTVSRSAGSPSNDHVEGLPEGDGTFLNAKEFKYATFFIRVKESVYNYWHDLAQNEYRRRDPTGNIYGIRDRSTMLRIQLNKQGRLSDVRVEQTSGVDFLDHVAVEAFKKAEPFPNPPPGIADEDGSIRFNFQFVVTMRGRNPLNVFEFQ